MRPVGEIYAWSAVRHVVLAGAMISVVIAGGCKSTVAPASGLVDGQVDRDSAVRILRQDWRGRVVPISVRSSNTNAAPIIRGVNLGQTAPLYCKEALSKSPNYRVLATNADSGVEVALIVSIAELQREVTFDQVSGRWILVVAGGKHDYSERIGVVEVLGEVVAPATGAIVAVERGYGRLEEITSQHEGGGFGIRGGTLSRTNIPVSQAAREAVFDMVHRVDEALLAAGAWESGD